MLIKHSPRVFLNCPDYAKKSVVSKTNTQNRLKAKNRFLKLNSFFDLLAEYIKIISPVINSIKKLSNIKRVKISRSVSEKMTGTIHSHAVSNFTFQISRRKIR